MTTPRFNLETFAAGESDWSHTDTVEKLDETAIQRGVITDRPSSGAYDDALYYATDQRILWGWDADASDWTARGGLGTESDPIPEQYVESLNTDDGTIAGRPFARGLSQDDVSDITPHIGSEIEVPADSYHVIFDVSEPVFCVGGQILGSRIGDLRITWDDGTTYSLGEAEANVLDENGDRIGQQFVPPIEEVTKLEFLNQDGGGTNNCSYEVYTY